MKYDKKTRKALISVASVVMTGAMAFSVAMPLFNGINGVGGEASGESEGITRIENVKTDLSKYYDTSVVQPLPEEAGSGEISIIVEMGVKSILDSYNDAKNVTAAKSVGEYINMRDGRNASLKISEESGKLLSRLDLYGINYELGATYNVVFGGFEIKIKASDFEKVNEAIGKRATLIVADEYEECETQVVNNDVNVHETGIFNSEGSGFDGSGTVVAVLDTGLDYTHTAFDPSGFEGEQVIGLNNLNISGTKASAFSAGLKAEDVYLNAKVPYAYDYADRDADVAPISSEHGTHVAGVIAGKDDTITGVAPNAQLAIFKVFSDTAQGAKQSWILSALEDCVALGVDVINMSLGSSCGFAREVDKKETSAIYNKIGEHGINLVCAASNDSNSTFGSEKNGNLGLTANPDSATVGSPSTYESALSVASISGVKRSYLKYNDTIMYFTESTGRGAKKKDFVNDILGDETEKDFEYVTIPGFGGESDYFTVGDVTGKIVLIKRGQLSFEDKAKIAKQQGAAGAIIYNNVSSDISMTVGAVGDFPVCSISQDNGTLLEKNKTGIIKISKDQKAGPFMSDFSSWGPLPDLSIKPEITAHGGEILSSVPGQRYDRLSGTSMACPNQAGVTALMIQYVNQTFPELDALGVKARVNQLMMSTADIAKNINGLPASVRKQGAGLANLSKATDSEAYITTFKNGAVMDKAKLELGDDPQKAGVYTMKFAVNNFKTSTLSYNVDAIVMTEGVSSTLTDRGQTTVTEEGYALKPSVSVTNVTGGAQNGNTVTVEGGKSAEVTLVITLSDEDKAYLDKSFENGMYVEGYVTLKAQNGVDLNVPFLAFYGDWTQAPMFDLDYFETNKDEIDEGLNAVDKTMADAYATRAVGGSYSDYITFLGGYNFVQAPGSTKIAADRKYISLSNQNTGDSNSTVHSIYSIYAGMLRGAKLVLATVTDSVTGEVIFTKEIWNQRKSYNAGSSIYPSFMDIGFNVEDYDLKNNTKYIFKLQGYMDYGFDMGEYENCKKEGRVYTGGGYSTNLRNTFEFPFVTDFQAPAVTGCNFRQEYDSSAKKTRLYAEIDIYDNHYSSAAMVGYISNNPDYSPNSGEAPYTGNVFDRYLNTLYSDFNSTYTLTYELTDYLETIKKDSHNGRSFTVNVVDFAQNEAMYEIPIPDYLLGVYFADENNKEITEISLSPNEIYQPNLVVTPEESWAQSVNLTANGDAVRIINGKIFALETGSGQEVTVTATANGDNKVTAQLKVKILKQGDEGFIRYDKPVAETFKLTQYEVNKVFYFPSYEDRGLGASQVGQTVQFQGSSYSLSMYPSESITVQHVIDAYYPESVSVVYSAGNSRVTVTPEGTITAVREGNSSVTVSVLLDGNSTIYSNTINISVKNPYNYNSIYLMRYTGNGGEVIVPDDLGVTEIYQYAFCGYHSVPKDENDEISDEDPYYTKPAALGDDTITKIVLPEGIETIQLGAFENLTALEEVVLPSTLKKIEAEAFKGCTKLKKINLGNVQFINKEAFMNCPLEEVDLGSIVSIGNDVFNNTALSNVVLPDSAQSLGSGAFANSKLLENITIHAAKVKLGDGVFQGCTSLNQLSINASVIPFGAFEGCSSLTDITLGNDVTSIGATAFAGTNVSQFKLADRNKSNFTVRSLSDGKTYLTLKNNDKILVLVSPLVTDFAAIGANITTVGEGAFSGNSSLKSVNLPYVTAVEEYAFANCSSLANVTLGTVTELGGYAFFGCNRLTSAPFINTLESIGECAFAFSGITSVEIANEAVVNEMAFAGCSALSSVTVGERAQIGNSAFMMNLSGRYVKVQESSASNMAAFVYLYSAETNLDKNDNPNTVLETVVLNDGVVLDDSAFRNCTSLVNLTIGNGVEIGNYAFYAATSLRQANLSKVKTIGDFAFSGPVAEIYVGPRNPQSISQLTYSTSIGMFTPLLTEIDLSSAKKIGAGAFAGMAAMLSDDDPSLTKVVLGKDITTIASGVFYQCIDLAEINLENVTAIGSEAFTGVSGFTELDLSSVEIIGALAFAANKNLTSVTLKEHVMIGDGAFMQDSKLATVANLDKTIYIGNSAFAATAITKADLTSALWLGTKAFAATPVTEVVLGRYLIHIGENPFAGCAIEGFVYDKADNTDNISAVKIIDGVLYTVAPNGGLVLVTYPMKKTDKAYTVAEGTVRIGAMAFYGAALQTVELPQELKAVGDKAFYGCENLMLVVFKSAQAPILEEAYDEDYFFDPEYGFVNLPFTGVWETAQGSKYEGLGIVPFYSWTPSEVAMFYGANFVNYVGKVEKPLIVVRPINGTGYETFVMQQYFDTFIDGAAAPYEETIEVIRAIANLPSTITLADEAQVVAVREMYNKITSNEQLALISNYSTLTAAEDMIEFLKKDTKLPEEPNVPVPNEPEDNTQAVIITLAVLTGVFGATTIAAVVWIFLPQLKQLFNKLFKKKQ